MDAWARGQAHLKAIEGAKFLYEGSIAIAKAMARAIVGKSAKRVMHDQG